MIKITDDEIYANQRQLPPRDRLLEYVYTHTGKVIPFIPICKGHNAPAEFLDHIIYGDGGVCAIACRSGSKTTQIGIGLGMLAYHLGAETRVLGGSMQQSAAAYKEFRNFLYHGFISEVDGQILQSQTQFMNGGSVELLVHSETSVRSPHVPIVALDELDQFEPKILRAAKFIPQSSATVRRKLLEASTRHRPMGPMSQEWDKFKGLRLIWCLLEVMAACTGDYKCSTCNLAASCPGKKIMGPKGKGRSGYYRIDDARELRDTVLDDESWDSEALCKEPRTEGQMYKKLEKRLHMPGTVSFNPQLPVHRAFDYGAADSPCVCQWWQIDKEKGRDQGRMIDEMRWLGEADTVIVQDMEEHEKEMRYANWIGRTFVPGDGASLKNELERKGHEVEQPNQTVNEGISTMRNLIMPNKQGIVGIIMDKDAADVKVGKGHGTWQELRGYHLENGKIIKKNDHGPDAARYFCHSMPELRMEARAAFAVLPDEVDIGT